MLFRHLLRLCPTKIETEMKNFSKSSFAQAEIRNSKILDNNKKESARMQEFHEKLREDHLPRTDRSMRFLDLVLVETDPKSGEIIPNSEKEPTKWGDWQHGGRVTDF